MLPMTDALAPLARHWRVNFTVDVQWDVEEVFVRIEVTWDRDEAGLATAVELLANAFELRLKDGEGERRMVFENRA